MKTNRKQMTPQEFIESNISSEPYAIARHNIKDFNYPIKCENLPSSLLKKAEKDLQIFADRQWQRLKKSVPLIGDAIIKKDGRKTFIAMFTYDGNLQDTFAGSFHIGDGFATYSGGFTMDVLNVKNLELTSELSDLICWIFSGGQSGGNRGVYHQIKVKTWREI